MMIAFLGCIMLMIGLLFRLGYIMVFKSTYYGVKATDLHQRERNIMAARGRIYDRNGILLADNKTVCTVCVIHNQIKEPEKVIKMLVKELGLPEEKVRKRVEKVSSIEKIKGNVDKKTGDRILSYGYQGVKVDEDQKRTYPNGKLASKVIGFSGGENQGILGLEVQYEKQLKSLL